MASCSCVNPVYGSIAAAFSPKATDSMSTPTSLKRSDKGRFDCGYGINLAKMVMGLISLRPSLQSRHYGRQPTKQKQLPVLLAQI